MPHETFKDIWNTFTEEQQDMVYDMLAIIMDDSDEESEDVYHHGIKGQKWGVRRFGNKNGDSKKQKPSKIKKIKDKLSNYMKTKIKDYKKPENVEKRRKAKEKTHSFMEGFLAAQYYNEWLDRKNRRSQPFTLR